MDLTGVSLNTADILVVGAMVIGGMAVLWGVLRTKKVIA